MTRSPTSTARFIGMLAGAATLTAGCGLFSGGPTPAASSAASGGPSAPTAAITPLPTPTPVLVRSITLIAVLGLPKDATPAGLTWRGIQATAGRIGATPALVEPATRTTLAAEIDKAATADRAVVVTVGSDAADAVLAAAAAHPTTQFLEMNVVTPESAPANVHGLLFDEAEAGYLAGYIAASFSEAGKVGIVGDAAADAATANYAVGFRAGAAQARPGSTVSVGYAGTADAPDKGRTAAATLIKGGDDTILAMPSLSGIGAMRETCDRKARFVAVGTDAWQVVPDVRPCLIATVLDRYDTAVGNALLALAAGQVLPQRVMSDVSNDGIAVGDLHADAPAGFGTALAGVVATLKNGPPRPTPAPATPPPPAAPSTAGAASASPQPSGA
ncbi:MAG TPA: BMP family ABC transporter substrate-binding protein [Terriglobales bacterium]|nr:BMP family ABC transporter substrate-binding protein [Terriglobales bacterium]